LQPLHAHVEVGTLLSDAFSTTFEMDPGRPHQLNVPDSLPPAWADETLLGEVVRNLIENAIRYSTPDTPIIIGAALAGDEVELEVTDHGEGVPIEDQARIFESFQRVSDDEARVKGSGLGLYFADRLIRAQGGSIRVESPVWPEAAAPGARFSLRLPIASEVPDDLDASVVGADS
jgi:two-component system sensor histidine kinase KdpD